MAQNTRVEICDTAVRVYEFALIILRDGVDRKVTTLKILFKTDVRRGIKIKVAVPGTRATFKSSERVFFFGLGVEVDGEKLPDRNEAFLDHGCF